MRSWCVLACNIVGPAVSICTRRRKEFLTERREVMK
uniref:Uncharacterized protein n=1 Tax=Nelumbo nucifera TaxID=4432 RepID=A0A822XQE9_NELNU|nr:TPA_asm: hypothetical protein HUJ06_023376 [Nelumbo nucifera]